MGLDPVHSGHYVTKKIIDDKYQLDNTLSPLVMSCKLALEVTHNKRIHNH